MHLYAVTLLFEFTDQILNLCFKLRIGSLQYFTVVHADFLLNLVQFLQIVTQLLLFVAHCLVRLSMAFHSVL